MTTNQPWLVKLERQAEKSLRRLSKNLRGRIRQALHGLGDDPRPHGCIKLTGHHNLWRIRVGDWRIVYAIYDNELIVVVIEIEPRANAYRNL